MYELNYFLIGNKTFIEKNIEHHVHDGEHWIRNKYNLN